MSVLEKIPVNFNFFDLELTSYNDRVESSSKNMLKEIFDRINEDRIKNIFYVFDRKENENNTEKRDLLIFSLAYTKEGKRIKGRMALLRNKLPVFLNNESDIDEIENLQNKKLAEITHFCVDFNKSTPFVMIEFNSNGPRISDFEYYIRRFAKKFHIAKYVTASLRVKGEVDEILKNLKNIGEIDLKVKPENAQFLKNIDHSYYSSITALNSSHPYQSIRVTTSFSRKKINYGGLDLARKLLNLFTQNIDKVAQIDGLKMVVDRGSGFEPYDLIREKENVCIDVEISSPGRPDSKVLFEMALIAMNKYI